MSDDLPMGWSSVSIADIGEVVTGNTPPTKQRELFYGGNIPFVKPPDLDAGEFLASANETLSHEGSLQSRLLPPDSILVNCIGNIGKVAFSRVACCTNQQINSIVPNIQLVEPKFVYWSILSPIFQDRLQLNSSATTVSIINKGRFSALEIPLPPLNEQRRIVDKLERIGDRHRTARNELSHIPKLIARYKQAVLTAACSGKLTEDWHTNSISSSKNKSVLLSEALLELKTGPFGSVLHKSDYVTDGIPIVNPMHINDGNITPSSEMTISIDKAKELSDFILKSGDVVIARRGVVGRCAVVQPKQDGWLCGTGSMILRPKLHLSPEYLQIFLSSPNTIEVLTADAVGSTMVNLNQRGLLSLEILLPQLEEQKEIVRRVEKMFEKIDMMEQEYQKAAKLCDRLEQATLAKAFRGELVPQDPDDELASVLLEQVKREKEKGKKGK